ncbi:MAG: glycoside hydrolase family 16 protein [Gammaproteobacteria bacterium]|nr:glycoside hydrolase family 16 protein [Gammaproteobacteria bacterium]
MRTNKKKSCRLVCALLALFMAGTCTSGGALATTLFFDAFDGSTLDQSAWRLPVGEGTFFGQTQIKPPAFGQDLRPVVNGGTVTLQLDTYNPTGVGSFWGHEIQTLQTFTPGAAGIAITSRMRFLGTPPGGLIGGFFTWGLDSNNIRDEIDFELLTNDLDNERVYTNVFDGKNFDQLGIGSNVSVPGLDLTEWNTYEIRWFADSVQWVVNGTLIREQLGVQLDRPSEVRFNIWVPNQGFGDAYNPFLQPAGAPGQNQQYELQIDFVRVSTIPVPPALLLFGSALALLGGGLLRRAPQAAANAH